MSHPAAGLNHAARFQPPLSSRLPHAAVRQHWDGPVRGFTPAGPPVVVAMNGLDISRYGPAPGTLLDCGVLARCPGRGAYGCSSSTFSRNVPRSGRNNRGTRPLSPKRFFSITRSTARVGGSSVRSVFCTRNATMSAAYSKSPDSLRETSFADPSRWRFWLLITMIGLSSRNASSRSSPTKPETTCRKSCRSRRVAAQH